MFHLQNRNKIEKPFFWSIFKKRFLQSIREGPEKVNTEGALFEKTTNPHINDRRWPLANRNHLKMSTTKKLIIYSRQIHHIVQGRTSMKLSNWGGFSISMR